MSYFILGCVMLIIGAFIGHSHGKQEVRSAVMEAIISEFNKTKDFLKKVDEENLREFVESVNEDSSEEDKKKASDFIEQATVNNAKLEIIKLINDVI